MSDLVDRIADVLLRQYDQQYDASHLTAKDFHDPAREIVEAIEGPNGESVGGFETARITITRTLTEDSDTHFVEMTDDTGFIEALGLIEAAKDTIIRKFMGEFDDDTDDDTDEDVA